MNIFTREQTGLLLQLVAEKIGSGDLDAIDKPMAQEAHSILKGVMSANNVILIPDGVL